MDVNSAFNAGLQALHRADSGLRRNAETIVGHAAHAEGREDVNTALVESRQHLFEAQAAVEVVKAADETLGTLINTTA